ncbi:MAG: SRPBCC domain-containing protein [Alphaproteobacteria bacterium]|nr:SRPBCC domain-containing protein [Alphaproteobacteria bacterium]
MIGSVSLVVRRTIRASAERLFELWTSPEHLRRWWGPESVVCTAADVDLRPGGRYRIANKFPDGNVLWIVGEFERVSPPRELVFSWLIEGAAQAPERVIVRFDPAGASIEVTVVHERVPDTATRQRHEAGWNGCLDGLARYAEPVDAGPA